jgi:hypothetical protein
VDQSHNRTLNSFARGPSLGPGPGLGPGNPLKINKKVNLTEFICDFLERIRSLCDNIEAIFLIVISWVQIFGKT